MNDPLRNRDSDIPLNSQMIILAILHVLSHCFVSILTPYWPFFHFETLKRLLNKFFTNVFVSTHLCSPFNSSDCVEGLFSFFDPEVVVEKASMREDSFEGLAETYRVAFGKIKELLLRSLLR